MKVQGKLCQKIVSFLVYHFVWGHLGVLQDVMRDRSLPGKVEFGQNSEFIPCLVLVLFGQKCTPIAKILLLMKRSAVSGCACTTQKKTSLPKWVTTCWLYCSLLLLFATHLFPFFQVWPMPFSLGIQSEDIFSQMYNYVPGIFLSSSGLDRGSQTLNAMLIYVR